jgi:predicted type IV restriction endonuclease
MMDLIISVRELAEKALDLKSQLGTEEATKNALIMPFINLLGYDVFNPREVAPEFTADVGTKKGEKVDYAILRDEKAIILIECKTCNQPLDEEHASQLFRYFTVTDARFGILTNGLVYRFYTDLESPNKMDEKPFLEIDLLDIKESVVEELKKFTRDAFDVDAILSTAGELKYTREIKQILSEEYTTPTEAFVRYFAGQVYSGRFSPSIREQFAHLTRRAFHQFVNDRISERLKSALDEEPRLETTEAPSEPHPPEPVDITNGDEETRSQIVTTEEEVHGFYVVKTVLHGTVDTKRIFMRDRISYCGILLDDTNRKPICRLHFNGTQKFLGVFNADKNEERIPIENVDDIYLHADRLKQGVLLYEGSAESS